MPIIHSNYLSTTPTHRQNDKPFKYTMRTYVNIQLFKNEKEINEKQMKWKCHRRWGHPILFIFSFFLKKNIFAFVSLGLCDCVLDVSTASATLGFHFTSIPLCWSSVTLFLSLALPLNLALDCSLVGRAAESKSHNRWSHAKFAHLIVRLSVRKCGLMCDKCNQFGNEKEIHADTHTHTIHTSKCKFCLNCECGRIQK